MSSEMNNKQAPANGDAPPSPAQHRPPVHRRVRHLGLALLVGVVLIGGFLARGLHDRPGGAAAGVDVPAVKVERGEMTVIVNARGAIWSLEPTFIKSWVEGQNKILEIVDEGTLITREDVAQGKVLARLDSSRMEESLADRQVKLYDTEAANTKAKESLDIRVKQNESDIAKAELNVMFARLELERYMGAECAEDVLANEVDYTRLGDDPRLGGASKQKLRNLKAAVELAQEDLARAEDRLAWTHTLYDKGYVNRNNLTADELSAERARIQKQSAEANLDLYRRYTLPMEAEKYHSDYVERLRDLDRVKAQAASQLAQAQADQKSAEANLRLERDRLDKARRMVENSVIRATVPGRLIYGESTDAWQRQDNPINPGASVREGQAIFQIPNLNKLSAQINVPEEDIDKLRVNHPALIALEALPGKLYRGHIARISPMASAAHAWLNPDKKVYQVQVALDETIPDYIPGMSATVYVIAAQLKDVVHIPLSAVKTYKGRSFCWVKTAAGPQAREVRVGQRSNELAEIRSGLQEGEMVYLAPPSTIEEAELEKLVEQTARRKGEERGTGRPETGAPEGSEAPPDVPAQAEPPMPPAETPAPQEAAASQNGQPPDWAKIGQQMQDLSPAERMKKFQEIINNLTPEQRKQMEEMGRRFQQMPAEERQKLMQQWTGGAAPAGEGAPAQ